VDGTPLADDEPTAVDAVPPGPLTTPLGSPARAPAEPATAPTQVNAPAGADDLIGRLIDNRYRILARISAGSVGVVYRAEHIQIRRPVAVKVLHAVHDQRDDYLRRFEREALAASKLNHPGCVSVLDFGQFEGRAYLVMEYVEGRTLAEHLRSGPLPLTDALLLTRLVLSALRHTHKLGVVHRDIKPANIMLCQEGHTGAQLRVLDFGLAKSLEPEDPAGKGVTLLGVVCGTPGYLSPEQAAGLPLDARSDLYSVGAVLFTMICGRRPFICEDPLDEMRAHIATAPPRASSLRPEISPALDALLARALEKDPAQRFQTADELIAALVELPEGRGLRAGGTFAAGLPLLATQTRVATPLAPAPDTAPAAAPAPNLPELPTHILAERPPPLGEQATRILEQRSEPSGGPGDSWGVLKTGLPAGPAWAERKSGFRVVAPNEPLEVPRDRSALRVGLVIAAGLLLAGAIAAVLLFAR
jgi:serine/threonine-protein kinase